MDLASYLEVLLIKRLSWSVGPRDKPRRLWMGENMQAYNTVRLMRHSKMGTCASTIYAILWLMRLLCAVRYYSN